MKKEDEIHIIYAKQAWPVPYIEELGYRVYDPYRGNAIPLRIVREIWFRLGLPFKNVFYNKKCVAENKTIIIYESLITDHFLNWLHNSCINCRYVLLYTNKVGRYVKPDQVGDWCEKWTCDKNDSQKYGMKLLVGGGYLPQWKVNKNKVKYDIFYIGKDKNRLDKLRKLEKEFNKHGATTMFYITWEKSWQKKKDGIHRPFLPYSDVLKYIGKSRAILHLLDGAQDGITIRLQEALIHKVKLITDDPNIVRFDFYHPNNIFIIGRDNIDDIKGFLDSPYIDVKSDFFNHAFYDDMIEEILQS